MHLDRARTLCAVQHAIDFAACLLSELNGRVLSELFPRNKKKTRNVITGRFSSLGSLMTTAR
jgi:hypothetical protein